MRVGQEMLLNRVQTLEEKEKLGERKGNRPRYMWVFSVLFVCLRYCHGPWARRSSIISDTHPRPCPLESL